MDGHREDPQTITELVRLQQRSVEHLVQLVEARIEREANAEAEKNDPEERKEPKEEENKGPIDWAVLTGAERRTAWEGLASFVEELVARYTLQLIIRPCWWRHGDAVEELTALWGLRKSTFRSDATASAAILWQDNVYKSTSRLAGIFSSCGDGHVEAGFADWTSDDERGQFRRMVQTDTRSAATDRL